MFETTNQIIYIDLGQWRWTLGRGLSEERGPPNPVIYHVPRENGMFLQGLGYTMLTGLEFWRMFFSPLYKMECLWFFPH